ncbi:hypothetical protein ACGFK1_25040 [Mycobacterium sp. NPDC048908]|uniref:hypothetical protein n=1 Tax=Mycobacterium sp. NPDC048908 TaxID=3364292 RepID=UPI003717F2BF
MVDTVPTEVGVLIAAAGSGGDSCTADGCIITSVTTRASRLLAAAVDLAGVVTPAEVRVDVAAVEPVSGAAATTDPVLESARKLCGVLVVGVAAVAVVLAAPAEKVEVDSAATGIGAADADEPGGELLCGPPVATTTPRAPPRVRLTSPAGDTEAAGPVGLDSAVGEMSPPGLLTAISSGGFRGLRRRPRASCAGVDEPDDDVPDCVAPDAGDELDDDCESDGELALESAGSASATPGVLVTAVPIPTAIANAPTRPMCFAVLIVAPPSISKAERRVLRRSSSARESSPGFVSVSPVADYCKFER